MRSASLVALEKAFAESFLSSFTSYFYLLLIKFLNFVFLQMETDTYAVVEFLNEKTVAVVPKKWMEQKSGVSCSFELANIQLMPFQTVSSCTDYYCNGFLTTKLLL